MGLKYFTEAQTLTARAVMLCYVPGKLRAVLDNRAFREYYIYTQVSSNKNLNSHYIEVLS